MMPYHVNGERDEDDKKDILIWALAAEKKNTNKLPE